MGGDISSRMTFLGGKVREPLLAVSGVIDKGNIVVFDGSGSFILPSSCAGLASVRRALTGVQGRIRLHKKNGVFVLRMWEPDDVSSTAEHQTEQAWTTRETVERKNWVHL